MERLIESISRLVHELERDREQREREHEWVKAHSGLVTKFDLHQLEHKIMATQKEIADQLTALNGVLQAIGTEVTKVSAETDQSLQKIVDLTAAINAGGAASQEVVDALAAVTTSVTNIKTGLQALDDKIPDAPPTV